MSKSYNYSLGHKLFLQNPSILLAVNCYWSQHRTIVSCTRHAPTAIGANVSSAVFEVFENRNLMDTGFCFCRYGINEDFFKNHPNKRTESEDYQKGK